MAIGTDGLVNSREASVLVTGGTGSFGNKFVETLLARYRPWRLCVFCCGIGLLGRPASESGRLGHGDGVPGGRMGHYHTFTPDSLTDIVDWMRANGLSDWELVAREDVDSKVGNGFTLVFRVEHRHAPPAQSPRLQSVRDKVRLGL